MKRTFLLLCLSLVLIFSACSKAPESTARVEVIDGIEYVRNVGLPVHPDLTIGIRVPHSAQSIFAGDQKQQRIYHMVNRTYTIETYDTSGALQRKIERPYDPLPLTSQDKEAFLARYEGSSNQEIKKLAADMDFPTLKNPVERLLCDDLGNLWVQTYETREDGNFEYTAYDRFDRDGIYDAKIWLTVRPEIIKNSKLYAQWEDEETGYTYVKRYSMICSR